MKIQTKPSESFMLAEVSLIVLKKIWNITPTQPLLYRIQKTLHSSKVSAQIVLTALYYIARLKKHTILAHPHLPVSSIKITAGSGKFDFPSGKLFLLIIMI